MIPPGKICSKNTLVGRGLNYSDKISDKPPTATGPGVTCHRAPAKKKKNNNFVWSINIFCLGKTARGALRYVGRYHLPVSWPPLFANLTPNDPVFTTIHTQWPQSTPNYPFLFSKFQRKISNFVTFIFECPPPSGGNWQLNKQTKRSLSLLNCPFLTQMNWFWQSAPCSIKKLIFLTFWCYPDLDCLHQ